MSDMRTVESSSRRLIHCASLYKTILLQTLMIDWTVGQTLHSLQLDSASEGLLMFYGLPI